MSGVVFCVPKGNGDCFTITGSTVIYDALTKRIMICGSEEPAENNCFAILDADDFSAVINAEWPSDLRQEDIARRVFGRGCNYEKDDRRAM